MRAVAIEQNDPAADAARFHLNAMEAAFDIDSDVISMVLSERQKQLKTGFHEGSNHTRFCDIADSFGIS